MEEVGQIVVVQAFSRKCPEEKWRALIKEFSVGVRAKQRGSHLRNNLKRMEISQIRMKPIEIQNGSPKF